MKKSWNTYKGKKSIQYQIVESYRDPETGKPKHRPILNISCLPDYAIEAVKQSLRNGSYPKMGIDHVQMKTGDSFRGAGFIAAYRFWKQEGMEKVLAKLTESQKKSAMAMILQRIFNPGSKNSLKESFEDSIITQPFSEKRLDSNELYQVMDVLNDNFYDIQAKLALSRKADPVLCLYDITSTYFEATKADNGDYGYSRDNRYDRYQIVIGLVCDENGLPLAVEVWPENTTDKTTVTQRITVLKKRFGIKTAIFVGDAGMYSKANIEDLEKEGFDYILHVDWHTQREQLEALGSLQLELFSQERIAEWFEEGVRYIGCTSEFKKYRAARRREKKMKITEEELTQLAVTAAKGIYYSWTRLREKIHAMLKKNGVAELWKTKIEYLNEDPGNPEKKARLELTFEIDKEAMYKRKLQEGKYVLITSLEDEKTKEEIDTFYRSLQKAERAFRHIKSYLKICPIYHRRDRRVRAHVLICFLACYLVKVIELELREKEIKTEVELLLNDWNKLHIVQHQVCVGEYSREEWNWSLGEIGSRIKNEISSIGWWRSIDSYKRSLLSLNSQIL